MPVSYANECHLPRLSPVHRLDVRTKIAITLATSLTVIFIGSPQALILLVAASLGYVLGVGRPGPVAIVYAALLAMWCMAYGFMHLVHAIWAQAPEPELFRIMVPFLRSMVMVNVILAIALSSSIQGVLTTLKSLRLPLVIYIPTAVMVRFIPLFMADIRQIREALRTRGHDGTIRGFFKNPLLTLRLIFVPIVFRALRSADELGMAAELKGVGYGRNITMYRERHLTRRDYAAFAAALIFIAAGVALHLLDDGAPHGMMR